MSMEIMRSLFLAGYGLSIKVKNTASTYRDRKQE